MYPENSKAHIYYILLISFITTIHSTFRPLKNALMLLEHQNGKKYDSLIIVSDTEEIEFNQNHVFSNSILDQTIGPYYYLHFSISFKEANNVSSFTIHLGKLLKFPTMTSLLLIFDFKVSNNVRHMMFNLQRGYFQSNTFLFVYPYDYNILSEENYFKNYLESTNSRRIMFDSQLYILNMNQTSSSLLE